MRPTTNQPETAEPVVKPEVAAMIEGYRPRFMSPTGGCDWDLAAPVPAAPRHQRCGGGAAHRAGVGGLRPFPRQSRWRGC